jgi:hypothetical protein
MVLETWFRSVNRVRHIWHQLNPLTRTALLLALSWLVPATVRAGCGDYIEFGQAAEHAPLAVPEARREPAAPLSRPLTPAPQRRCSGPLCSAHPFLPPLPEKLSPTGDRWLDLNLIRFVPDTNLRANAPEEMLPHLERHSAPLERPPRPH